MKSYKFILIALLLTACTDSVHKPLALDDNFGRSFRQIKQAQILNPYAAKYPPITVRKMDGDVGKNIMNTYREGFDQTEKVQPVNINIGGTSSSSN